MKFGYCIIYVPNVLETVTFYETAFGLIRRFVHESGDYAELETGETTLAFASEQLVGADHEFVPNRASARPAGAEVGLVTEDVQAAFDHAISSGAARELAPVVKPWGQTVSYVRDNNGFLVEICSKVG